MDWKNLAEDMLHAAKSAAGSGWISIKTVAKHEFEVLAKRFVSIAEAIANGEVNKGTAKILYRSAKSQLVAILAMLSTLIASVVTKIVNAAISVVKGAINAAIGFSLI